MEFRPPDGGLDYIFPPLELAVGALDREPVVDSSRNFLGSLLYYT